MINWGFPPPRRQANGNLSNDRKATRRSPRPREYRPGRSHRLEALAETYFMSAVESDSSLLFGMLALQNGLVEQPDLLAAFQYWCKDRSCAMAQFLVERGALSESDRAMIDGLIRRLAQTQANAVEGTPGTAAAARDAAALPAGAPRRIMNATSCSRACWLAAMTSRSRQMSSRSAWGQRAASEPLSN